jgi:uncharacterized protein YecE (DUF72 family)
VSGHCFIGTAGWSLPREVQDRFGPGDSHLQRYATRFPAAEINSSFHRPHKPFVWERWRDTVPPGFRFSAKLPKSITHERRLKDCSALLDDFFAQARLLGDRLGCVLVQLPPSLSFELASAQAFLRGLRQRWPGMLAMEPRHASWFDDNADALLRAFEVGRVLADPMRDPRGSQPGGWPGLAYLRLHGSPRVYYSAYEPEVLVALARRLRVALEQADVWCIFDNTASGAATANGLALQEALAKETP